MEDCYLVVEFIEETHEDGSIPTAIISSKWIYEDNGENMCWWPNFKSDDQRRKAIVHHKEIDVENCMPCKINVKYKTDVYQKAVVKLRQLEQCSDINTEEEILDKRQNQGLKRYSQDFVSIPNSDSSLSLSPPTPPNKICKKILKGKVLQKTKSVSFQPTVMSRTADVNLNYENIPVIIETTQPATMEMATCSSCATIEGLCKRILEGIEKNKIKLLELTAIVNASIAVNANVQGESHHDQLSGLPLQTVDDMDVLEAQLGANRDEYSKMLNVLKFVGGKDTFDTTRRVISRIISNNLALVINWVGRNDKRAFKNYTNILSLISDAVRMNPLTGKASEKEIFAIIKMWLRGAVDRDGGRNRRKKE